MRSRLSSHARAVAWVSLVVIAHVAAGCGPAEVKTLPVEGNVTLGDQPLKGGSIAFHPDAAKGNTYPRAVSGRVENGRFKLMTSGKDGAPAGWYKVTVAAGVKADPKDEYSTERSLVADKFRTPAATPLAAEVKEGGAGYDFKVTK